MKEIVFCTHNAHKLQEVKEILRSDIHFLSLDDILFKDEIPEPFDTLEANAYTKANTVRLFCGKNCFAEDSGLFVKALNGAPGVFSARYAGIPVDNLKNIEKLLSNMQGISNREAYFKTVIAYVNDSKVNYMEGICNGKIALSPEGNNGFGYDSVFIPQGFNITFAQMSAEEKNEISHRKKAFVKFKEYIHKNLLII